MGRDTMVPKVFFPCKNVFQLIKQSILSLIQWMDLPATLVWKAMYKIKGAGKCWMHCALQG